MKFTETLDDERANKPLSMPKCLHIVFNGKNGRCNIQNYRIFQVDESKEKDAFRIKLSLVTLGLFRRRKTELMLSSPCSFGTLQTLGAEAIGNWKGYVCMEVLEIGEQDDVTLAQILSSDWHVQQIREGRPLIKQTMKELK